MAKNLQEFFRNSGRQLPTLYARSILYENSGLGNRDEYKGTVEQNVNLLDSLQGSSKSHMGSYTLVTTDEIAESGFRIKQPLRGVNAFSIVQSFGSNAVSFYKSLGYKGHTGIDYKATTGTETLAVCSGEVIYAGDDGSGGLVVEYLSDQLEVKGQKIKLRFLHYHLLRPLVKAGDAVMPGQEVGLTDNTGLYTTGPHLHFGCKILYKVPDNEGGWVTDFNNGYKGAVNPEPLFDSFDYQLYPVDTCYGLPEDVIAELYIKAKRLFIKSKLRRFPTRREEVALAYGRWDIETVMNPALFELWATKTKN